QPGIGRAYEVLACGPVAERLRPVVVHRPVVHRLMSVTMSVKGSTAEPHFVGAGEPKTMVTRSARNSAFLTLYARMTAPAVRGNQPVRAGAISVAAHPAPNSQQARRAMGPSTTAMNGITQMRYWGEKTLPVMMNARIAAPLYRTPSFIPRRANTPQT